MDERAPGFARNQRLEQVLEMLNRALADGGDSLAEDHPLGPRQPVLLVCGTPRSGSTVLMQWLASSGAISVPTNLISRFYRAPAVGALVQRILFDPALDFRGELTLHDGPLGGPDLPFQNDVGKTRGPREPNEFWYFWRHFLGFADPPALGRSGRAKADVGGFLRHLGALESVEGRPLALKALIASWDLDWLSRILPTAIFLDQRRDPIEVMASLLRIRQRHGGDIRQWYSFRLPGNPDLSHLSPTRQVAVQVRAMRHAIDAGLASVGSDRVVRFDQRSFVEDPGALWDTLAGRIPGLPSAMPPRPRFISPQAADDPELRSAWAWSAQAQLG